MKKKDFMRLAETVQIIRAQLNHLEDELLERAKAAPTEEEAQYHPSMQGIIDKMDRKLQERAG